MHYQNNTHFFQAWFLPKIAWTTLIILNTEHCAVDENDCMETGPSAKRCHVIQMTSVLLH